MGVCTDFLLPSKRLDYSAKRHPTRFPGAGRERTDGVVEGMPVLGTVERQLEARNSVGHWELGPVPIVSEG